MEAHPPHLHLFFFKVNRIFFSITWGMGLYQHAPSACTRMNERERGRERESERVRESVRKREREQENS